MTILRHLVKVTMLLGFAGPCSQGHGSRYVTVCHGRQLRAVVIHFTPTAGCIFCCPPLPQEEHKNHKHVMAIAVVNETKLEVAHGLAKSIVEVIRSDRGLWAF